MNALTLPDIARQTTTADLPLDWVGMQGIALPVQIGGQRVAAEADAGVSLTTRRPAASICRASTWRWPNWNRAS